MAPGRLREGRRFRVKFAARRIAYGFETEIGEPFSKFDILKKL
jgi:hypothetical protein